MKPSLHGQQVAAAANSVLGSFGLTRKGKSRLWIDDRAWWTVLVEFQPSGFSKGTYLNVAPCWLWVEKDYFSFDEGCVRVGGFLSASDADSFEPSLVDLATRAKDEVLKFRTRFATIESTASYLRASSQADVWTNYHTAISAGLIGDEATATTRFCAVLECSSMAAWVAKLQMRVLELTALVTDRARFRLEIKSTITKARKKLRLPSVAVDFGPAL